MSNDPRFLSAHPYQKDVLSLPVEDIDSAADWYGGHFGMRKVERSDDPVPTVILERDGVRIGFAVNGGDASQDGAAIEVSGIEAIRDTLLEQGVNASEFRVDERDGKKFRVFFVVAPDGLCYYFHEPMSD